MSLSVVPHVRWHILLPLVYLAWLALAESLITFTAPLVGLGLHAALLLTLLAQAGLYRDPARRSFALVLCLGPLIRLLSMTLPLAELPQISWYAAVTVPLFITCFLLVRILKYTPSQIGLRIKQPGTQTLIALFGLLLGVIEYVILQPQPLIAALTWQQLVLPALVLLIFTGFGEELMFRGIMQRAAYTALGRWGIIYVAALFAVLHIGYRSLFDLLFVFVVGLGFGFIVARTGSLLGVTLAHGFTNILLFLVIPFTGLPTPVMLLDMATRTVDLWMLWGMAVTLWLAMLLLGTRAWLHYQRRQQLARDEVTRKQWEVGIARLLTNPLPDAIALEQLALLLWARLDPNYVLIVGQAEPRREAMVELAIGATGRRLRGIEGLAMPQADFAAMLQASLPHGLFREVTTHPFSRYPGDYLLLPLPNTQRWAIVSVDANLAEQNRAALTPLGTMINIS